MSARFLVDSNVLLRFLTGEPVPQAAAAKKLFGDAAVGEVILDVSPVIIAETIYTLISFYEVERKKAAEKVGALLRQRAARVSEFLSRPRVRRTHRE